MRLDRISKAVEAAIARANFNLRPDVARLLKLSISREKNRMARQALFWILDNARIAQREKLAICQDTGLPVVFIEAGKNVRISYPLVKAIKEAVTSGYKKNYLRASLVDPILRGRPSYRGAIHHISFNPGQADLKVTVFPKGFGSENKSALKMFNPTADFTAIEKFIIESIKTAGPESCPPFIVGVGIGGTSDTALLLAKEALLGRVDKPNRDKSLDNLEKRLLKRINTLGIGPMGLGGSSTALAVKMKKTATHIAGLPVAVNISCHALRSAAIRIKVEG